VEGGGPMLVNNRLICLSVSKLRMPRKKGKKGKKGRENVLCEVSRKCLCDGA
jgi:hypothetical protein